MTTQRVQPTRRHRFFSGASIWLLLSIQPVFAGIAAAQTREVSHLATGHPLLADHVTVTRDADSVQVRAPKGQPLLAFDSTDLDFGTVAVGDSSGWRMVLLTNTGAVDATALDFTTNPEFPFPSVPGWQPCYGWSVLPAGGTCLVTVKFAPASSGPADGTLSVSSAEGGEATLDLTGAGSDQFVLYGQFHDWTTQPTFFAMLNSHYLSEPARNSELADDFEVEARGSWIVSAVGLEAPSPGRPAQPPSADIYFMPDADGLPGDTPVCAALASQFTLWETPVDESRAVIQLSSPCTLAPGHYWLRVIVTVDTQADSLYWGLQFIQNSAAVASGSTPPMHLYSPVWRNPEGGVGYPGCSDWTPLLPPNCGIEEYPDSTVYGSVFWIIGQEIVVDPIFADGFEPQ